MISEGLGRVSEWSRTRRSTEAQPASKAASARCGVQNSPLRGARGADEPRSGQGSREEPRGAEGSRDQDSPLLSLTAKPSRSTTSSSLFTPRSGEELPPPLHPSTTPARLPPPPAPSTHRPMSPVRNQPSASSRAAPAGRVSDMSWTRPRHVRVEPWRAAAADDDAARSLDEDLAGARPGARQRPQPHLHPGERHA